MALLCRVWTDIDLGFAAELIIATGTVGMSGGVEGGDGNK